MPVDNPQSTNSETAREHSRISIKFPSFQKNNIRIFFTQLQAIFSINSISDEITKFNYLLASLDAEILSQISEFIPHEPNAQSYKLVKEKLELAFQDSTASQIRSLLQDLQLDNQKPSSLLRKMRNLAAHHVTEEFLKNLFLSKLPRDMQAILSISSDELNKLGDIADKIAELNSPSTQDVFAINENDSSISQLQAQIDDLTKEIKALKMQNRSRAHNRNAHSNNFARSSSNSRNRYTNNSRRQEKPLSHGWCYYHAKFKQEARKCTQPCAFSTAHSSADPKNLQGAASF